MCTWKACINKPLCLISPITASFTCYGPQPLSVFISLIIQDQLQGRAGSFSSSLPIFYILSSCQLIHSLKGIWIWIMPEQEGFCFLRLRHWVELYKTGMALLDRVGSNRWVRQEIPTKLWYPGRKKNKVTRTHAEDRKPLEVFTSRALGNV